ncbi:hypothetical protein ACFWMS_23640 [Peribacillus butanolivorans]|uniref:DUF7352 domain-containing protein n=1 Tax=Peribacillus butanolivorans TaxID=421767 RepID=UPI00365AB1AD
MKTIEEFPLNLQESNIIEIPCDTRILSVKAKGNSLFLYGLVLDTEEEKTDKYDFRLYGPGENINIDILDYTSMGSVQVGESVIHVFSKQIFDGVIGEL